MATTDKYDRQIRLWGMNGQQALQQSRVLLLGLQIDIYKYILNRCSPAGVETIKNLILPGIGYITIVDDQIVSERDATNNFFTPYSTIGQPRAQITQQFLSELNSDVQGTYIIDDPQNYLKIYGYNLIIANEFTSIKSKLQLSKLCEQQKIDVIYLNTIGFIGKMRIQGYNNYIIESKPMGKKIDLRIQNPWKELLQYFEEINTIDDPQILANIPYIVILNKVLQQFKIQYGKFPITFAEKNQIYPNLIQEMSKLIPQDLRANFFEAKNNISQAFSNYQVTDTNMTEEIQYLIQLFKDQRMSNSKDEFWVLLRALKKFIKMNDENLLPLPRYFPDIECSTQTYIQLKRDIYGQKSLKDFNLFKQIVFQQIQEQEIEINISDDKIWEFVDNSLNLKVIDYRSYEQEYWQPLQVCDTDQDGYKFYIALKALDQFNDAQQSDECKIEQIYKLSQNISSQLGVDDIDIKYIDEVLSQQDCRLHVIGSIIGGMASQECIKLLTKQFIPINNTLIYNGINGEVSIYEL